jgi:hypothetical protein
VGGEADEEEEDNAGDEDAAVPTITELLLQQAGCADASEARCWY